MSFGADYASIDGNKPPYWPDFLKAGASFVWIRGSFAYWDSSHRAWACVGDPVCHRDWAGIPSSVVKGGYFFPVLEASQSPEEQVAVFKRSMDALGGLRPGIDFPPCIDLEFPGKGIVATGLDRAGVLAWLRRAVAEVKRLFGCLPILYTSARVWDDTDADCLGNPSAPDLVECPLWLARYPYKTRLPAVLPPPNGAPPVPTPWISTSGYIAWQDQGDALNFPGFTATVDVDEFHTISPGDHDPLVLWYKRKLHSYYLTSSQPLGTTIDITSNKYDNDMKTCVCALQASWSLTADGILGPKSFALFGWLQSL